MIRLETQNCNMILKKYQQKYQFYHLDKTDKYEYLTGEEILSSNQRQIIKEVKVTYSLLRKAFEKQTKTIEEQGEKQIKTIEDQREKQIKFFENRVKNFFLTEIKIQSLLCFQKIF